MDRYLNIVASKIASVLGIRTRKPRGGYDAWAFHVGRSRLLPRWLAGRFRSSGVSGNIVPATAKPGKPPEILSPLRARHSVHGDAAPPAMRPAVRASCLRSRSFPRLHSDARRCLEPRFFGNCDFFGKTRPCSARISTRRIVRTG